MEALVGVGGMLFMALFVVVLVLIVVKGQQTQRQTRAEWAEMASRLGLQFYPHAGWAASIGEIQGVFQGRYIKVFTESRGAGKSRTTYTCVHTWMQPPLGLGLRLEREGLLSLLGKAFGGQDLKTGDAAFDGPFVVKAQDTDGVLRLLDADLRALIQSADRNLGPMTYDDEMIRYEVAQVQPTARLEAVLHGQAELAHQFSVARSAMEVAAEAPAWEVARG